jgi:hypothetical protein
MQNHGDPHPRCCLDCYHLDDLAETCLLNPPAPLKVGDLWVWRQPRIEEPKFQSCQFWCDTDSDKGVK